MGRFTKDLKIYLKIFCKSGPMLLFLFYFIFIIIQLHLEKWPLKLREIIILK